MRWDELAIGTTVVTAPRTLEAADVAAFGALTGDRNALHDPAAAPGGAGAFGTPVAHGMLVASVTVGLVAQAGVTKGCLLALVETSFVFKAPVHFGDTVRAKVTVAERRETRSTGRGLVTLAVVVTNQRDEVVQEAKLVELVSTG